jgi:hypothetical protein
MDRIGGHLFKWNKPGSEGQQLHTFSHMWNTDLIQIEKYYAKHITLRGGHVQEEFDKWRKLKGKYKWCTVYTRVNIVF